MRMKSLLPLAAVAFCLALIFIGWRTPLNAQRSNVGSPSIDSNDVGGVVNGPNGPEAGVWVIAETKELGTRFVKIVVTDDNGRYVLPGCHALHQHHAAGQHYHHGHPAQRQYP